MELCAQDVNTPSETAHHKPGATHHEGSPFLALPPELRLVVYDIVLSDLVGDPLGPIYKLPAELPFNDITGFIRLSLVCRDIRHELRHHFEQTYLNKVMLYFHDPYELCRVFKLRSLLASEYGSLRFTFIRHSSAAIHSLQAETNPASSALFDDGIDLVYSIYARYNRPRLCQTHVHKFKHEFDASGLGRAGCPECPRSELRMCTTSDGIGPRIIHQQATCRKPEAECAVILQRWQIDGNVWALEPDYFAVAGKMEDLDESDFNGYETSAEKPSADQRREIWEALQSETFLTRPAMADVVKNLKCQCCLRCRYADGGLGHVCRERMKGPHQDCECGLHEPRCSHE